MRISDWSSDVCSSDLPRVLWPARSEPLMPSFAPALETTLHKALEAASSRRHEYATLEHLLLALVDDEHASKVMDACSVDLGDLKATVTHYLDTELEARSEAHTSELQSLMRTTSAVFGLKTKT